MTGLRHVRFDRQSEAERQILFDEMTSVATRSVTPGLDQEESWAAQDWIARRAATMAKARVYEARQDGQLVGFVSYWLERLRGRPAIYIQAACVLPEHHSTGLAYQMNARILLRTLAARPWAGCYLAAHVINPMALKGWMSRLHDRRNCYPHIGAVPPPKESLVQAACEFVARHDRGLEFDQATGVVRGRHLPGPRFFRASGDPAIDDHFARHVDPNQGDTVLMVLDGHPRVLVSQLGELARAAGRSVRRPGPRRRH